MQHLELPAYPGAFRPQCSCTLKSSDAVPANKSLIHGPKMGTQRSLSDFGITCAASLHPIVKRGRPSSPQKSRPDAGGTRLVTCPLCGVSLHVLLAAAHVDRHFQDQQESRAGQEQPGRDPASAEGEAEEESEVRRPEMLGLLSRATCFGPVPCPRRPSPANRPKDSMHLLASRLTPRPPSRFMIL